MKNIELLAPAGSMESLNAAINAGANAIYIGGSAFGARKTAGFSNDELKSAVETCHKRGVSLYVTVNTLIKEEELISCIEFVDFLYEIRVDALILQDFGLMRAIRERYPDFDCHASTQMTLHSTSDVLYAAQLGFSRVVLAREVSLEDIKKIRSVTDIELEVFVHGALCISYSGNCLMSSMIGGRSGNRGSCAQPCRKKYTLKNYKTGETLSGKSQVYLLSPKDLFAIKQVETFKAMGNISLKIEGRLKGADYVYNVVSHYRQAIDGRLSSTADLSKSFNRQLTEGHLLAVPYSELMNYELPSGYGTILGKVKHYEHGTAEIVLFDTLNKGDEIQNRVNGRTSGSRSDIIYKGQERVESADKGDVVKVPYKTPLKKNAILYKTYDKIFIDEMIRQGKNQYPRFGVKFEFEAHVGNQAILKAYLSDLSEIEDFKAHVALKEVKTVSLRQVEEARSLALDESRITEQLSKLGGTAYYLQGLAIDIEAKIALPISELNRMRREVIEMIDAQLKDRYPMRDDYKKLNKNLVSDVKSLIDSTLSSSGQNKSDDKNEMLETYRCHVMNPKQLERLIQFKKAYKNPHEIEIIYHDLKHYMDTFEYCFNHQVIPALPKIITNAEMPMIEVFLKHYFSEFNTCTDDKRWISIAHIAHQQLLSLYPNAQVIVEEDAMLFNSLSMCSLKYEHLAFSHEVTLEEARSIMANIPVNMKQYQWFVYGRFPVMTSEYCVVGGVLEGHDHCGHCSKETFALEDEVHDVYPLVLEPSVCRMQVLLPKPIYHLDKCTDLKTNGITHYKISFLGTTDQEMTDVLNQISTKVFAFNRDNHSRGHYRKAIE